jgi:hypothetical protein
MKEKKTHLDVYGDAHDAGVVGEAAEHPLLDPPVVGWFVFVVWFDWFGLCGWLGGWGIWAFTSGSGYEVERDFHDTQASTHPQTAHPNKKQTNNRSIKQTQRNKQTTHQVA